MSEAVFAPVKIAKSTISVEEYRSRKVALITGKYLIDTCHKHACLARHLLSDEPISTIGFLDGILTELF